MSIHPKQYENTLIITHNEFTDISINPIDFSESDIISIPIQETLDGKYVVSQKRTLRSSDDTVGVPIQDAKYSEIQRYTSKENTTIRISLVSEVLNSFDKPIMMRLQGNITTKPFIEFVKQFSNTFYIHTQNIQNFRDLLQLDPSFAYVGLSCTTDKSDSSTFQPSNLCKQTVDGTEFIKQVGGDFIIVPLSLMKDNISVKLKNVDIQLFISNITTKEELIEALQFDSNGVMINDSLTKQL